MGLNHQAIAATLGREGRPRTRSVVWSQADRGMALKVLGQDTESPVADRKGGAYKSVCEWVCEWVNATCTLKLRVVDKTEKALSKYRPLFKPFYPFVLVQV